MSPVHHVLPPDRSVTTATWRALIAGLAALPVASLLAASVAPDDGAGHGRRKTWNTQCNHRHRAHRVTSGVAIPVAIPRFTARRRRKRSAPVETVGLRYA
jgi:hypothetical protein